MQAAIWAVLLIAGSWLILYTVNPKLLEFNLGIDSLSGEPSGQASWAPNSAEDLQRMAACEDQNQTWHRNPSGGIDCQ
jgi:hypothetical protein